jgi:cyclase
MRIRVIPVLLIDNGKLIKSLQFRQYTYLGDPINAIKIFNDKEVDEIVVLDISKTRNKSGPDLVQIRNYASEAFMPMAYGGGITQVEEVKEILYNGIEKVIVNKAAFANPGLITEIATRFGSQSIVVSIDVKANIFGKKSVYTDNGRSGTGLDPVLYAKQCVDRGAGEILLNSVNRDGTYKGYDIDLVNRVAGAVDVPVIAVGGASSIDDFREAVVSGKASAVAAGSLFVFQRPHNAVLISYPSQLELSQNLYSKIPI